jgi:hypothetical protein
MQLGIRAYEYSTWVDKRLAYANNANIPEFLRKTRIDLESDINNIWIPWLYYTEIS